MEPVLIIDDRWRPLSWAITRDYTLREDLKNGNIQGYIYTRKFFSKSIKNVYLYVLKYTVIKSEGESTERQRYIITSEFSDSSRNTRTIDHNSDDCPEEKFLGHLQKAIKSYDMEIDQKYDHFMISPFDQYRLIKVDLRKLKNYKTKVLQLL